MYMRVDMHVCCLVYDFYVLVYVLYVRCVMLCRCENSTYVCTLCMDVCVLCMYVGILRICASMLKYVMLCIYVCM